MDRDAAQWQERLQAVGVHPDELHIVPAAIELRRRRLGHALAGGPPEWLTWWYGPRPTDPGGAQVWDDEINQLAAWRDARHLTPDVAGYGPRPSNPVHDARWEQHLDRSLTTRNWLHQHSPTLPPPDPIPVDIVAVRNRLDELDAIVATAPPDQTRIVDAIRTGELAPADLHQALVDAAATQNQRRQWILEHWAHVVEHAELARISSRHDPLAHWSAAPDAAVQRLHEQLVAITTDTPEASSLIVLDERLAEVTPDRQQARLATERHHVTVELDLLRHVMADVTEVGRFGLLAAHRERLAQRLTDIDTEARQHTFRVAMWNSGSRPRHLTDAIARRANHLAHTAITTREPWVLAAGDEWHAHHPDGTLVELHQVVIQIAALRERTGHHGDTPLGRPPATPTNAAAWQHLDRQLRQPPDRRISDLLPGR